MVLLKLLIFTLTFYKLIAHLDAKCAKGEKVTSSNNCEACHDGYFQPEETDSRSCKVCQKCDEKSTIIVQQCTKVSNTICKCREGFDPWPKDTASCYCPKGSGIKEEDPSTCSKCEHGFFSAKKNLRCKKWKECKSSEIQVNGTDTTDAVCTEKKNDVVTTAPTSNKVTSFIKHLQTTRPREGAQTQEMNQVTTTTTTPTTTATTPRTSSGTRLTPNQLPNTGNLIGMTLLLFGIVGLLILTAVTCRLHITPCMQRKRAVQANDPLCRRPVEESGDDSLYPLKLNPEKP